MKYERKTYRRGRPVVMILGTVLALILASLPMSLPAIAQWQHDATVNDPAYKKARGYWSVIDLPNEFKINTIHAALLPTGKVLLVAGSGNQAKAFDQYRDTGTIAVLKTVLYDPANNSVKLIDTPSDLFCAGHAMLQSGKLLIAGGTSAYEKLGDRVTKPAGAMMIYNEDPNGQPRAFKRGTRFIGPADKVYVSTQDFTLQPAMKVEYGNGRAEVKRSSAKVFVEAVAEDPSYVTKSNDKYTIEGLTGTDKQNIYGQGGPMTLNKQDYRGDNKSYEFDYVTEQYVRTGDLNESRWYPSLPVMNDGTVRAVSGLDNVGQLTNTTEVYDPAARRWSWGPSRSFPTYPAFFRTPNPDVLFFSGSNAGYGPVDDSRQPGFWNVKDNTFKPVPGLRDADLTETSGSVMLPPPKGSNDGSQSARVMIAGGGGVGESNRSTARTDIIDLSAASPMYTPGPQLPAPVRYINLTVLPTDEVFATGGSTDYRAKGNSYSYAAAMINPTDGSVTRMADETVGRSYHAGSLLLPDGRVLVFGNDPLFADKDNTTPSTFEQRVEVYTPPSLFQGGRPAVAGKQGLQVRRGERLKLETNAGSVIKTARLIPPSTSTHVTNVEQRSVGAVVTQQDAQLEIGIPADASIVPNGWYMLFVTDQNGAPSKALMVQVVG